MKKSILSKNGWGYVISAAVTVLLVVVLALRFDFYYCLNDDMAMKDILSGNYTGTPEGRNIQMLYPLGAFISFFYKVIPQAPWYGLFLCGCQFLALYLVCSRAVNMASRIWTKVVIACMAAFLTGSVLLYELIYVQYTVTCGVLMAAAAFWFYTSDAEKGVRAFLLENCVSIVLVAVAFMLRTEMVLLLCPFLAGAGICKWSKEKQWFSRENLCKYVGVVLAVVGLCVVALVIHAFAYRSPEWQKFNRFFDARTEIYDFLSWPSYEEGQEFYEKEGLSQAEVALIDNYNFALDDAIDEEVLEHIAEYQKAKRGSGLFLTDARTAVWIYKNTLVSLDFMPYNVLVLFVYLLILFMAVHNKDKSYIWKIPMLLGIRSVCWFYIIFRNRMPERITTGMFLMELMVLVGLLALEWNKKKSSRVTVGAVACVIVALALPAIWSEANLENRQRERVNKEWIQLQEYFRKNPENFYLVDVYSTVSYTEKMFENVDNSYKNYDLCGGWTAKSPIHTTKMTMGGITDVDEDLLHTSHVYFVSKANRDVAWLEQYYAQQGENVRIEIAEEIEVDGEVRFVIYRLL